MTDPAWQVRDAIAMTLYKFPPADVETALHEAENDIHPDVRWSAQYALTQLGLDPSIESGPT
jgi:HEAT repeat protein